MDSPTRDLFVARFRAEAELMKAGVQVRESTLDVYARCLACRAEALSELTIGWSKGYDAYDGTVRCQIRGFIKPVGEERMFLTDVPQREAPRYDRFIYVYFDADLLATDAGTLPLSAVKALGVRTHRRRRLYAGPHIGSHPEHRDILREISLVQVGE